VSLTQAERERLRLEFDRLNRQGWADDKRRRVEAFRANHPGWGFAESWDAVEREEQSPAPELATGNGVLAKPFHQVEAAARALMAADPRLPFGVALVRARVGDPPDPGTPKDSRVVQELAKHKKLEESRKSTSIDVHVDRLAKVRKLMAEKNWSYDQAFTEICRQESGATAKACLVTAQLAIEFDGLPAAIQYMPAGKATITPNVNGSPKEITVTATPRTAAALQADLSRLLNANVRPFVDFDHAGGAAAAIPKRFFWKEGEGVMLELDWTNSGKAAVSGRDYSYFSPTFLLNESGDPAGLPPSGAIGSLVNNPAFRSIKRIAALQGA
jgi:Mu-like prophage I protein